MKLAFLISLSFNRSITKLKSTISKMKKSISEIPTYYKMLRKYLVTYTEKYTRATAVIQADKNECFFKTMITIPHAVDILKKPTSQYISGWHFL